MSTLNKELIIIIKTIITIIIISLDLAVEETEFVKNRLNQCAFTINFEKSVWQSQKELVWLGIKYK